MAWLRSLFSTSRNQTLGCLGFIVLLFSLLHAADLWDNETVLSMRGTDIEQQFYGWRDYGFSELKEGRIPFWNPYVYGGAPFLAGMQSALFYPLHVLYLILPLPLAIDGLIVLHLIIGGAGFYFWARYRKLPHFYALAGGCVWPLCGVVYPHLLAGHLPNLIFLAWVPSWFHALEKIFAIVSEKSIKETLLGEIKLIVGLAAVLSMMVLGGHIQYLYYLMLGSAFYGILHLVPIVERKAYAQLRGILMILGLGLVMGFALTAFQWVPMLFTLDETVRSKLSKEFASMFSFPLENIITFILPHFFGDIQRVSYWGRCYLWEMSLYMGIIPLIVFFVTLKRHWQEQRALLILAILAFLLALGKLTPLYDLLYMILPGYSSFRGVSKFSFLAILPILMLSLHGLKGLSEMPEKERGRVSKPLYIIAAILALIGLLSMAGDFLKKVLSGIFTLIKHSGESYLNLPAEQIPSFIDTATRQVAIQCISATILIAAAAWLLQARKILWKDRLLILLVLGMVDVVLFSRSFYAKMPLPQISEQAQALIKEVPEGARILNLQNMNLGVLARYPDFWGNDPFVLRRYSEWVTYSLGRPIEEASQYLPLHGFRFDPMHAQARLYGVARLDIEADWIAKSPHRPMPEAFLVQIIHIEKNIYQRLARLKSSLFDPSKEAIIEEMPSGFFYEEVTANAPPPQVEIYERIPGHYSLKVDSNNPALLILGTNYSKGWKAKGLPDSAQYRYTIIPANHAFLSIPINPGFHHITLDYIAPGWNLGLWISTFAGLLIISLWLLWGISRRPPGQKDLRAV